MIAAAAALAIADRYTLWLGCRTDDVDVVTKAMPISTSAPGVRTDLTPILVHVQCCAPNDSAVRRSIPAYNRSQQPVQQANRARKIHEQCTLQRHMPEVMVLAATILTQRYQLSGSSLCCSCSPTCSCSSSGTSYNHEHYSNQKLAYNQLQAVNGNTIKVRTWSVMWFQLPAALQASSSDRSFVRIAVMRCGIEASSSRHCAPSPVSTMMQQ
eukprot:16610-Heterococcus_DN1.PRE.6